MKRDLHGIPFTRGFLERSYDRRMYVMVEDNPNCCGEERMLRDNGKKRIVQRANVEMAQGTSAWCDVTGVEEGGRFCQAHATQVEDSSAGTAWLIFGGTWGLRFRPPDDKDEWTLKNPRQWGEPLKVFDISGADIEFADAPETS